MSLQDILGLLPNLNLDSIPKDAPAYIMILSVIRVLAEGILRLAPLIGAKYPALSWLASAIWQVGKFIGWFGGGTPKPVVKSLASTAKISKEG